MLWRFRLARPPENPFLFPLDEPTKDEPMSDTASRIQADINENPVMLYMKGTAMFPQCGFSARVAQILNHLEVPYKTANVLEDQALREAIKAFSNWPTIPQLYIKGEFIGGCDIVMEMFQSGELQTLLSEKGIPHKAAA
ncbi:Glutaredoxin [Granulibacter bethesdensis]|nr:Glutaredoxin [Granulibacter bethesdensis]